MMRSRILPCRVSARAYAFVVGLLIPVSAAAQPAPGAAGTRLLRQPSLSATHIAFAYANDIWLVDRNGGAAQRLTSFQGQESEPHLSPDGRWVAFAAQYGGNTDVYVVAAQGGEPRRLTWHPGADTPEGWTPDGERIVFKSARTSAPISLTKLWSVARDGGWPEALPLHRAHQGKLSEDGQRIAYRMVEPWEDEFRNYRGGQNRPIWIVDLPSLALTEVPWTDSNDQDPVWVGDDVYFLSDRDYAMNIWAYDGASRQVRQVTRYTDYDVKNLSSHGNAVAFEQAGYIHLLDTTNGSVRQVPIEVRGDFAWAMPHWQDAAEDITNAQLSPTGVRALVEAHGEILTIPTDPKQGDWRNLTASPGTADRSPAWSADGRSVSWFSDEPGEYALIISDQNGLGEKRTIALESGTFYYTPAWSPDSRKILFTDTDLNLWVVDVASGRQTKADTDNYMVPDRTINPVWSPDSRWIAYVKRLDNQLHAVFVYDVQNGSVHQLTDGMSDAISPAWDRSGKYLYFLASTNFALNTGWLDMTSYDRPITRAAYMAVLDKDEPSPLLPRVGDEAASAAARDSAATGTPTVTIDFDGIAQRILSLNLVPRDYSTLATGVAGNVFVLETVPATGTGPAQGSGQLHRWILNDREAKPFLSGVQSFVISADGKKLLANGNGNSIRVVETDKAPPAAGDGALNLANVQIRVDPRAEWQQMFNDGWRFQRDYLYVENMHGADWTAVRALYEPLLEHVRYRSDLTYLLDMMGGEIAVGHSFVFDGDTPEIPDVDVGLLGADFTIDRGRYRIARIYNGESWNPGLQSPLAGPGIRASEGDYILAVNGQDLTSAQSIYALFEGTAGRQTVLRLNSTPSLAGSWEVTVVPVQSENQLRQLAWVENNRRIVDEMSDGQLAYVWVPNTGGGGYTYFNRYFFAQQDKKGAIIDERFNQGGSAADYIVDVLGRDLRGYFNNPVGERKPFTSPGAGIWGPKVMLINEEAGSGGDLLPYMFRQAGIGPLIGTRTWGGLVGIWDTPPMIDGGGMLAPRGGFFNLEGEWDVENEGIAPDITVEITPADAAAGRDTQLEAGVREALRLLRENPVQLLPEPAPPVRWRKPRA